MEENGKRVIDVSFGLIGQRGKTETHLVSMRCRTRPFRNSTSMPFVLTLITQPLHTVPCPQRIITGKVYCEVSDMRRTTRRSF